jgi:hypothetical protein
MTDKPLRATIFVWSAILIFFVMTGLGVGLGVKAYRWVTGDCCDCTKPV